MRRFGRVRGCKKGSRVACPILSKARSLLIATYWVATPVAEDAAQGIHTPLGRLEWPGTPCRIGRE